MNRDRYHAGFDGIQFRKEFEEETVQLLLEAAGQQQEKERSSMKVKHFKKTALIAAVLAVAVMATAAAVNLLHPAQVAEYMGHSELADAFNSEDAILLNESKEFGDFTVTLMGVTSGARLAQLYRCRHVPYRRGGYRLRWPPKHHGHTSGVRVSALGSEQLYPGRRLSECHRRRDAHRLLYL